MLGVDPRTVTRWANGGLLTVARTPGGHRRFYKVEVDALRAALENTPGDARPGVLLRRLARRGDAGKTSVTQQWPGVA
jgi:hypothetical protein